jgi:hypothetical protein
VPPASTTDSPAPPAIVVTEMTFAARNIPEIIPEIVLREYWPGASST